MRGKEKVLRPSCKLRQFTLLTLCAGLLGLLLPGVSLAEDITTLDGKTYENARDIKTLRDGLVFSYGPESAPGRVQVLFRDLPADLQRQYGYDPFEAGLAAARLNSPVTLTLNSAFRLANLEAARQKAQAEKKLLGFIMVWDVMFRPGARPMGEGGPNDLAGFYTVFNNALVLVFVRHEDELDKVPNAVKKGFFGPEEGGWAPNMAVVTADCSKFICEIPLGGGQHSTGSVREPVFRHKIDFIKQFLEHPELFTQKPLEDTQLGTTNTETAGTESTNAPGDGSEVVIPGQHLEGIRKIPQATRLLYGGIAIGALLLLVIALRLFRK